MVKWIITLIFSNFVLRINTQQPITWWTWQIITNEKAESCLAKIEPLDALPVVLFQPGFKPPEDINKAVTLDGKMIKGTTFSRPGLNQIFYCAKPDSDDTCLAPKEFQNLEELRCTKKPTVIVRPSAHPGCTSSGGTFYSMVYEICDNDHEKYELLIYQFCYDEQKRKTLFTTHLIWSSKLLKTKLLYREQNLEYPYEPINGLETANYEMIHSSLHLDLNSLYWVQKLVPSKNMAFGTWRDPTYRYVNSELQHMHVFNIWNEINDKVREEAIRIYKGKYRFSITTGVFDNEVGIPQGPDGQILNKWVTMIFAKAKEQNEVKSGIVILMNNFLNFNTEDPKLKHVLSELETFCKLDVCVEDIKNRVQDANGQIRCCMMTPKIGALFGLQDNLYLPPLRIRDLIKIT